MNTLGLARQRLAGRPLRAAAPAAQPGFALSRSSRWRSASAPTPRSSSSSTPCGCARCRSRTRRSSCWCASRTATARAATSSGWFPSMTHPLWERLRDASRRSIGAVRLGPPTFDLAAERRSRIAESGLWVSGDFFRVLGVTPARRPAAHAGGRCPGCALAACHQPRLLAARVRRRPHRSSAATMSIGRRAVEVVGVTAAGFFGLEVGRAFDVALPLCAMPS